MKNILHILLIISFAALNGEDRLNERYHTYEEIRDSLFAWDEQFGQNLEIYPGSGIIYHLEELGLSENDSLPFWGVRLSFDANQKQDKPRVLFSNVDIEKIQKITDEYIHNQNVLKEYAFAQISEDGEELF